MYDEWEQLYPCLSQLVAINFTVTIASLNCERLLNSEAGKTLNKQYLNSEIVWVPSFPTPHLFLLLFPFVGEDRPEKEAAGGPSGTGMQLSIKRPPLSKFPYDRVLGLVLKKKLPGSIFYYLHTVLSASSELKRH